MCRITNLDDTGCRRGPLGLRVSPEELKVDDGVGWCDFHKLFEDRRPFDLLHARHRIHTMQNLIFIDSVVPALFLSTGHLIALDDDHVIQKRNIHRGSLSKP